MYNLKQVIVVRKDLNMRKGKLAAQVAHASTSIAIDAINDPFFSHWMDAVLNWFNNGQAKIVVSVDSEEELINLQKAARRADLPNIIITDSGYTEFHGVPTKTCCAIGPGPVDIIDQITGHLKLI